MCWRCEVMHPGMALRAALSRAGPHTSAGRGAGTLCRRAARGAVVVTRKPTSRSETFSARLRASWARPQGAERPEDPQGWCSEHVCHNEKA